MCHALIPKEEVQKAETDELINKIYDWFRRQTVYRPAGKKLSAEQDRKPGNRLWEEL